MKQIRTLILFVLLSVAMLASVVQCSAQLNGNFGRVRFVPKSTVTSTDTRNGVMMYNSTLNRFRFYEDGQWKQLDLADTFNANVINARKVDADTVDARLFRGERIDVDSVYSADIVSSDTILAIDFLQGSTIRGEQLFLDNADVPIMVTADGVFTYAQSTKKTYIGRYGYWQDLFPARTTEVKKYEYIGSNIVTESIPVYNVSSNRTMTAGRLELISVFLYAGDTITGVQFFNTSAGNYTASDNNKVGLYTISGETFTLAAQSANTATAWQNLGLQSVPFTGQYIVTYTGTHYISLLYNRSVEVSAPVLASGPAMTLTPFTTLQNRELYSTLSGQTNFPATTTFSATALGTQAIWLALY